MSASKDRDAPLVMAALRAYELGDGASFCIGLDSQLWPVFRNGVRDTTYRVYLVSRLARSQAPHVVH